LGAARGIPGKAGARLAARSWSFAATGLDILLLRGVTTGESWDILCPQSKFSRFYWFSFNICIFASFRLTERLDWFFSPFLEKPWSVCLVLASVFFFEAYEVFHSLCISGFIPQLL